MRQFPVMLFAAGFGSRMGALTKDRPKPLIEVAGRPLIDHALAIVDGAGVERTVVNLHYRGHQIAEHLKDRNTALSWENGHILETGGGLRAALPLLGTGPVMTLNTDAVWSGPNPLTELRDSWLPDRMDALLLLAPKAAAIGHGGLGDFLIDDHGKVSRAAGNPGMIYLGAQILCPDILSEFDEATFSLNEVWDRLIAKGRVFGCVYSGLWCDVGKPEGIATAEAMLARSSDD